jgi:outer membrane protein
LSAEVASVNLFQSKASFFPSISGSSSYVYNFGRSVNPYTNIYTTEEVQSGNVSLNGNLNLFSGLQLQYALAQSRLEYYAGTENLNKVKNDISLNVAAAYLQVLYSGEALKLANDRVESAKQTRDKSRILVDAGSMAQGNLLDAEAALAAEELAQINAANQERDALLTLTQLLEIRTTDGFVVAQPQAELPEMSAMAMKPDEIYTASTQVLPEFRASELGVQIAEKGLSLSRSSYYPRLSMFSSISTAYTNIARRPFTGEDISFEDQINENYYKTVGLSLSIPIFSGFSTRSGVDRSKINLENEKLKDKQLKNQVYKSIAQAHNDAQAALKRYQAAEKSASASREALSYAGKKYDAGMLTSIDYLNVKNNANRMESELIQAKYDLIFRVKLLDFYLGKPLRF